MSDDEMVYVSQRNNGGSTNKERVYHTNTDCRHYREDNVYEWPKQKAEAWEIRECRECSGDYERTGGDQSMHYALKRLGEEQNPKSE